MKTEKSTRITKLFIPLGLFIASAGTLLNLYPNVPDFLKGTCIGAGIGLMLASFIKLKRERKAASA